MVFISLCGTPSLFDVILSFELIIFITPIPNIINIKIVKITNTILNIILPFSLKLRTYIFQSSHKNCSSYGTYYERFIAFMNNLLKI